MIMVRRWLARSLCALWLSCAGAAHADPPASDEGQVQAAARAHYERGRAHFNAGRYREAISELRAALALDPDSPPLMYNVAYASELSGKLDQARHYYRAYLAALPEGETAEREKTQATLARLEAREDRLARQQTRPAPQPQDEASRGRADFWFWGCLGGGAALLAGGAVTGVLALQHENEVAEFVAGEDGSVRRRMALADDADTLALASDAAFIGGAALVTTAALLYFLRDDEAAEPDRTPPRFRLKVGPKTLGLTLSTAF